MTDIVEEARAMLAQATPGPWRFATNGFDRMVVGGPVVVREFIDTTYETGTFIVGGEPHEGAVDEDDPNIKLIIAAPSLLAALADECERLRAENARHVDFRMSINKALPRPFGVTVLGAIAELRTENALLQAENERLRTENERLREAMPTAEDMACAWAAWAESVTSHKRDVFKAMLARLEDAR